MSNDINMDGFNYYGETCKFETARLAREKGFEPPISSHFNYWEFSGRYVRPYDWFTGIGLAYIIHAPTQEVLQSWIRKNHEIHIEIYSNASGWGWILTKLNGTTIKEITDDLFFETYELALEMGLVKALMRIKNPKKK